MAKTRVFCAWPSSPFLRLPRLPGSFRLADDASQLREVGCGGGRSAYRDTWALRRPSRAVALARCRGRVGPTPPCWHPGMIGMLALWPSVPLTAMIYLGGEQVTRRTIVCYARSPSKGGPMTGRTALPRGVLGLVAGVALLAALGVFVSGASSQNQAPRGTHAFHATKDCSGFTGLPGASCTFRSSNVEALKVGSKIFYFSAATKTAMDSDMVIYVGPGLSQPAIASFITRPGSDCARSPTAREPSPGSMRVYVSRPIRRSPSCGTGTGLTASVTVRSGGESAGERAGRRLAFIALGQVHRRVRVTRRRSGDLHERLLALLVLSGQQAGVDSAAAGEGEVGRGRDRPVLHRPDQEDEGDLGPALVLHGGGLGASTTARRSRDRRVLR